jgi:hypothetical protein
VTDSGAESVVVDLVSPNTSIEQGDANKVPLDEGDARSRSTSTCDDDGGAPLPNDSDDNNSDNDSDGGRSSDNSSFGLPRAGGNHNNPQKTAGNANTSTGANGGGGMPPSGLQGDRSDDYDGYDEDNAPDVTICVRIRLDPPEIIDVLHVDGPWQPMALRGGMLAEMRDPQTMRIININKGCKRVRDNAVDEGDFTGSCVSAFYFCFFGGGLLPFFQFLKFILEKKKKKYACVVLARGRSCPSPFSTAAPPQHLSLYRLGPLALTSTTNSPSLRFPTATSRAE